MSDKRNNIFYNNENPSIEINNNGMMYESYQERSHANASIHLLT